jgi:hypothetical protein
MFTARNDFHHLGRETDPLLERIQRDSSTAEEDDANMRKFAIVMVKTFLITVVVAAIIVLLFV